MYYTGTWHWSELEQSDLYMYTGPNQIHFSTWLRTSKIHDNLYKTVSEAPPPQKKKKKKTNNNNPTHNNNKPTNHKTRSYARITHSSAKQTHLWPLNKVTAIKPTMNLWTPSKVKPSSVWTTWFKQCSRKPVLKVLSNRERPISLEYIWKLEIARSSGIFIIYSR